MDYICEHVMALIVVLEMVPTIFYAMSFLGMFPGTFM